MIVRVLSDGPELYGDDSCNPTPVPSETMMNSTAIAANAPAMAALHENGVWEASPPV